MLHAGQVSRARTEAHRFLKDNPIRFVLHHPPESIHNWDILGLANLVRSSGIEVHLVLYRQQPAIKNCVIMWLAVCQEVNFLFM